LKYEIDCIKKVGVQIETDSEVKDIEALKKDGYKAILLAVGAQSASKLDAEGANLNGVIEGMEMLKDINSGKKTKIGNKVIVIGGGNVAVDCARTALRLGAKEVSLVYRRSKAEMPAIAAEVVEAEDEGVKIVDTWGPKELTGKAGKITAAVFQKYTGTRKGAPTFDAATTKTIECDTVILAIGQSVDLSLVSKKSAVKAEKGLIAVKDCVTDDPAVFAAGDAVSGPKTVIEAIAAGHAAARAIAASFGTVVPFKAKAGTTLANLAEPTFQFHLREITKEARVAETVLAAKDRAAGFKEVNTGFADKAACIKEARRCITCRCTSMGY